MLSRVDIIVLTSNYIQRITGLIRSDFYRWRKSICCCWSDTRWLFI